MLALIFRDWLARFPPEVLRSEPEAVVIQVFLGELFLEKQTERVESAEQKGADELVC